MAARRHGLSLNANAAWTNDSTGALSGIPSDTASFSAGLGLELPGLSLAFGLGCEAISSAAASAP